MKPRWLEHLDPRYHIARARGDKEKARQLEQFWTNQEDKAAQAFVDGAYFVGGFGNAMANNLSGGFIGRQKLTDTSFVMGQRTGDLTSLLLGVAEISAGGGMTQTGALVLTTGAPGAAVGAPMTAAGLALAGHGIIVTNSAVKNLASDNFVHAKSNHKGGSQPSNDFPEKGGGKNGPHANAKAKDTAYDKWLDAKAKLERIKRESKGKPGRQKMIKEAEAQVKHWQSQANFKGENHSRNAKGNNNGGRR